MEISGKKQVNIREDNKSAVIHLLLQQEFTLLQMSERLKLSHTALAKVMKELMAKNVVTLKTSDAQTTGRPPKVYSIDGDCAIACAVVVTRKKIYVYYFDMRGFQINEHVSDNHYESMDALLQDVLEEVVRLKVHPRLQGRVLKYIHIGLPSGSFLGREFAQSAEMATEQFTQKFPAVHIEVNRNVDYEIIAEQTYGLLKDGQRNAVLLNFDDFVCASFLFDGVVYNGDTRSQGLLADNAFCGLNALMKENETFAEDYAAGRETIKTQLHKSMQTPLAQLRAILRFLDVHEVVVTGVSKKLGDGFLSYLNESLGGDKIVRFTVMGKNVQAALAGAVWLSTYSTLREIISR